MKKHILLRLAPFYILIISCFLLITLFGDRAVTVSRLNSLTHVGRPVIIDAGHGGEDGGATSCTGVLESQINLEISLKLNDLLKLLGINTVMIRTDDRSVYTQGTTIAQKKVSDLRERVRIVNEAQNPILISIHQNYFSNNKYSGTQVFCNQDTESVQLAKDIQSACKLYLNNQNNRKIKQAKGIYLMEKINCSAVLIECGFLSNPEEEAKLRDSEYQKILSAVIAVTVCNHLDHNKFD